MFFKYMFLRSIKKITRLLNKGTPNIYLTKLTFSEKVQKIRLQFSWQASTLADMTEF